MRAQYPSRGFEDEPRRQQQVSRQMELEMTPTVCQVAAAAAARVVVATATKRPYE